MYQVPRALALKPSKQALAPTTLSSRSMTSMGTEYGYVSSVPLTTTQPTAWLQIPLALFTRLDTLPCRVTI